MVASKRKAPTVAQLAKRISELEAETKDLRFQLERHNTWIHLLLTTVQSTLRWAYAWSHVQKDQKRMDNFKLLGTSLNDALEEIEPDF